MGCMHTWFKKHWHIFLFNTHSNWVQKMQSNMEIDEPETCQGVKLFTITVFKFFFCGYVSEINTIKYQNSWGKKLETCLISMPKARVCGAIGLGSAETMAFEYLQRGKLHGQPLPVFYHPPSHESEVFFKCLNRVSGIPVSAHCLLSCVLESVGRIIPFLLYHSSADIYWLPALLECFFFSFCPGEPRTGHKMTNASIRAEQWGRTPSFHPWCSACGSTLSCSEHVSEHAELFQHVSDTPMRSMAL